MLECPIGLAIIGMFDFYKASYLFFDEGPNIGSVGSVQSIFELQPARGREPKLSHENYACQIIQTDWKISME